MKNYSRTLTEKKTRNKAVINCAYVECRKRAYERAADYRIYAALFCEINAHTLHKQLDLQCRNLFQNNSVVIAVLGACIIKTYFRRNPILKVEYR